MSGAQGPTLKCPRPRSLFPNPQDNINSVVFNSADASGSLFENVIVRVNFEVMGECWRWLGWQSRGPWAAMAQPPARQSHTGPRFLWSKPKSLPQLDLCIYCVGWTDWGCAYLLCALQAARTSPAPPRPASSSAAASPRSATRSSSCRQAPAGHTVHEQAAGCTSAVDRAPRRIGDACTLAPRRPTTPPSSMARPAMWA